jgi:hypothetical protein
MTSTYSTSTPSTTSDYSEPGSGLSSLERSSDPRLRYGGPLQLTAHFFDVADGYPFDQHLGSFTVPDWNWGPADDDSKFPTGEGSYEIAALIWNFGRLVYPYAVSRLDIAIVGRDCPMPFKSQQESPDGVPGLVWAAYRDIEEYQQGHSSDASTHDLKAWADRDLVASSVRGVL